MADSAQCTKGECCTSTCQFKAAGTTCRSSSGQCDIEEYCSGESSECPADVYLQDGTSCNNNQAYCFSGECQTYNKQCQYHFRSSESLNIHSWHYIPIQAICVELLPLFLQTRVLMRVLGLITQEETILETVALMGPILSHVLLGTRTYMHTPSLIPG